MAVYARYPIAQALGMGENFFIVFSALPAATAAGFANGWQVALGVAFISGVLFLILSLIGLRELIFNSTSPSLKNGIAAGIGLFIAFVGLRQAGVIVKRLCSSERYVFRPFSLSDAKFSVTEADQHRLTTKPSDKSIGRSGCV